MTERDVGAGDDDVHDFETEFLDDTSDAHATMFGFWKGLRAVKPSPTYEESRKEVHYFYFGYFLGWMVKTAVLVFLGTEYLL